MLLVSSERTVTGDVMPADSPKRKFRRNWSIFRYSSLAETSSLATRPGARNPNVSVGDAVPSPGPLHHVRGVGEREFVAAGLAGKQPPPVPHAHHLPEVMAVD